ncbi:ATP-dependent helicase [Niastella caeni]|uniref:DNA 3'-5' helicase n=1 Tax=Niastella caeni TaxID=2569763 RepID=A0A4S8HFU8_9BACT|nr:ATP-dependent helicase [Niastella caeni]THU32999.1 ATP-dependent helicase [Niastella caeni]
MPVTTPTVIQSDSIISPDGHFRVSAGPGAGKTYWLVEHIKNVLQHSGNLGKSKKIACITYTNIAADTIVRRLDFVAERVEVSTIHAFLYKHVIKPYATFIAAEYELNVGKMDGHDDHFPSGKKIKYWLDNHPNRTTLASPYTYNQLVQRPNNFAALKNWLESISYQLTSQGIFIVADNSKAVHITNGSTTRLAKQACLDKLDTALLGYKKIYWKDGILHHEDVLFFAHKLITRFPFILTILKAKFPYFFIDEFQDTNPIQADILRLLGDTLVNVGIIGDKAQSIYKFQGADMKQFDDFKLPALKDFMIADNRRSTNSIIDVLNSVRSDIFQKPVRQEQGTRPIIYVGDMTAAVTAVKSICGTSPIATLSRDNITANTMKRQLNTSTPSSNLIDDIFDLDGDSKRRKTVVYTINAIELARQKRFKEAIKEISKNFREITDKGVRKKIAFLKLSLLLSEYEAYKSQPLLTFFQLLKQHINPSLSRVTGGKPQIFYTAFTYEQLAVCVSIQDDNSLNRTIHKAKGDEFDNVVVILKEEANLTFLLNPSLLTTEEHRIFYVGISRTRERLFISVPTLDTSKETKLRHWFDIVRL